MASLNIPVDLKVFPRAEDAMEFLNRAFMTMDGSIPSVLVTDVRLPGMSGHDLVRKVRSNVLFAQLPVAIYSWTPTPADIELAYKTGANAIFSKLDMAKVVKNALNLINTHAASPN